MNDIKVGEEEWLTRQEVAKIFRVTPATVKRWEADRLQAYKVSDQVVRYRREDVEALPRATHPEWVHAPAEIVLDKSLLPESRLLLMHLLAAPEDKDSTPVEIAAALNMCEADVRAALAELKDAGRI